jgi:hypothetical protein
LSSFLHDFLSSPPDTVALPLIIKGRDIVMNITQRRPSRKRPVVITVIAIVLALVGISELVFVGIWMMITRRMLFSSSPLRVAVIDYLIQLLPSFQAQIVFSMLVGIFFIIIAWGLSMLKSWSYWVTLIIVFPSWMIYDLSKILLLYFHIFPSKLFENPNISSNATTFVIELVVFILILRGSVRRSFYPSEVNMIREDRRERV